VTAFQHFVAVAPNDPRVPDARTQIAELSK
jgi:hypothetical protein